MSILTVNLVFSTLIFWIGARIYLIPRLPDLELKTIVTPILLLHSFRHLGLMFLAPGAVYSSIPDAFAFPAAIGDFVASLLALIALPLLLRNRKSSMLVLWIFNVEGTVDLILAITLATYFNASPYMGAAYWIPSFWVPSLLVTHYLLFSILLEKKPVSLRHSRRSPRSVRNI